MVVGGGAVAVVRVLVALVEVMVARVEQDGERWAQTRNLHHMY